MIVATSIQHAQVKGGLLHAMAGHSPELFSYSCQSPPLSLSDMSKSELSLPSQGRRKVFTIGEALAM